MSWNIGRETILRLLDDSELQTVAADLDTANALLAQARRHLVSAETISASDPNGAFATQYDAARKACAALLQAQGLRPTSRGGHVVLRDAVIAQFAGLTGGQVLRSFDRLRRRRNEIEYPNSVSSLDLEELDEAMERTSEILDFAEKLTDSLPVFVR